MDENHTLITHWENAVEIKVRVLRLEKIASPLSKSICINASIIQNILERQTHIETD